MRLLLFFIVLACLWGGGQGLYTGLTNTSPTKLSCADYLLKSPGAKWVTLTNCYVDYTETVQITSKLGGSVKGNYVPVRAAMKPEAAPTKKIDQGEKTIFAKAENTTPVKILLKIDPHGPMKEMFDATTETAQADFLLKNLDKIVQNDVEVTGLIQFGIDSDDKTRKTLATADWKLAPDFIVIEQNKKPEVFIAGLMFFAGCAIVYFTLFKKDTPKQQVADNAPPPPQMAPQG